MFEIFKLSEDARFSNKYIIFFLLPILFEQVLVASLSFVDTFMISQLPNSEIALAGIANVARLDTMLKQIFVALAAGGGIFVAQYIGAKRFEMANKSIKMSVMSMLIISILVALFLEIFKVSILNFLFGKVEEAVMTESLKYYSMTILTYPFMALFNCGTASFRSMGKSKITLVASVCMMLINIVLKYLFLFKLKIGVSGAGLSLVLAYAITGIVIFIMLCDKSNKAYIENPFKFEFDGSLLKRIYMVALPSGIENGLFQIGALILQTLVASLGTVAINSNHLTTTIAALMYAPATAFTLGVLPIVSRCMGAGKCDEAEFYAKHIVKMDHVFMGLLAVIFVPLLPSILSVFKMSGEITREAVRASMVYFCAVPFLYPRSFAVPSALRGAGDTKFTMTVSVSTMFLFRIGVAYIFVKGFNLGILSIWVAMVLDWVVRSLIFHIRFTRGKWKEHYII